MLQQNQDHQQLVAEYSLKYVKDGMNLGLGSGTTVNLMLRKLGDMVKQGLKVKGIPTSRKTELLAKEVGIPLVDFSIINNVDLTIDGAKEIDRTFAMIKGGGGSFFREKLVAEASKRMIIIAERSKVVESLGSLPVPVEITPFAWESTIQRLKKLDCKVELRMTNNAPIISDNGNYIVDCKFESITDAHKLDRTLKLMTGVLETGIFCGYADLLITMNEHHEIEILEIQ